MYNMRFESTQSRGRRIEQTMNDIAWESNMPEDNLVLKEYELPTINSDDILPLHKPIRNTLQQFMELREEICDEESNHLSRKVGGMELEREQPFEEEDQEQDQNYYEYPQETYSYRQSVQNQPAHRQERKASPVMEKYPTQQQRNMNYPPVMSSQGGFQTQNSQDPQYMQKLAKALENTKSWKGKLKYSQKFSYPSSSTFLEPKKRNQGMSQMGGFGQPSREDIEDLEDIEEDGVYVSNMGQKKLKLEMHVDQPPPKQYAISFYGQQQQIQPQHHPHQQQYHHHQHQQQHHYEHPRENEIEIEREKGFMETLEKALRKPGNQSPRKWTVKIVSSNTVCGISSVEFINFSPEAEDKNSHYAIINSAKQYYPINVAPNKKYCLLNPRIVIDQTINNKRVYCVDRIEELGK